MSKVDDMRDDICDFVETLAEKYHPTNAEVAHALGEAIAAIAYSGGIDDERELRLETIGEL